MCILPRRAHFRIRACRAQLYRGKSPPSETDVPAIPRFNKTRAVRRNSARHHGDIAEHHRARALEAVTPCDARSSLRSATKLPSLGAASNVSRKQKTPVLIGLIGSSLLHSKHPINKNPARRGARRIHPNSRLRRRAQPAAARGARLRELRWKNSAWLATAETIAGWNGFEIRNAGSGRSPVRKRSG
jgi:hypothetical protein